MNLVSHEIIVVFSYLLPGFIAAWVYYGLTAYPKPSQFERIVQALIFTIIIQVLVNALRWFFVSFNFTKWTENSALSISLIIAILIGLFFSRFANNDKIHSPLRKMSFTKQTSFPSEWFGAFSQNKTYVVLHLKDQRRLYG